MEVFTAEVRLGGLVPLSPEYAGDHGLQDWPALLSRIGIGPAPGLTGASLQDWHRPGSRAGRRLSPALAGALLQDWQMTLLLR